MTDTDRLYGDEYLSFIAQGETGAIVACELPSCGTQQRIRIQDFAWSHDGKRLAVVRFATSTDIVLLRVRSSKEP